MTHDVQALIIFPPSKLSPIDRSAFHDPARQEYLELTDSMMVSLELARRVENQTRRQAENDLLYDIRSGRLASSLFEELLHRRSTTDAESIVRGIMGYNARMTQCHLLECSGELRTTRVHARLTSVTESVLVKTWWSQLVAFTLTWAKRLLEQALMASSLVAMLTCADVAAWRSSAPIPSTAGVLWILHQTE